MRSPSILIKRYIYYFYRLFALIPIFLRVVWYGLFHPQVLFNFAFGVVSEVAEFHKRCGGNLKNFRETILYQEMTKAMLFPRSNCINASFGTIRPMEAQILSALVEHLKPKAIFEIGAYNGFSTMHLAKNSPSDAKVYTLDLPPENYALPQNHDINEAYGDIKNIKLNSFRWFHSDECRGKITELFGDSTKFDYSPYHGKMDLVFIDANHSYSYVKSDTENALKMLSPKGMILWHDYDFIHPGIFKYLNEFAAEKSVYYIERTRFALLINKD